MSKESTGLIATSDAAKRLGVTSRHVARLVSTGKLDPVVKAPGIRGAYFFDREDIEALAKGGAK